MSDDVEIQVVSEEVPEDTPTSEEMTNPAEIEAHSCLHEVQHGTEEKMAPLTDDEMDEALDEARSEADDGK